MQPQNTAQNNQNTALGSVQMGVTGSTAGDQMLPPLPEPDNNNSYMTDTAFQELDLFEALAMDDLTEEEKASRIEQILDIVANNAIMFDLPDLLPEAENQKIVDFIDSGEGLDMTDLTDFMGDILEANKIDFDTVVYTRSLKEKHSLIDGHIDVIEEAVNMERKDNPAAPQLEQKANVAKQLRAAFTAGEWDKLSGLFKQYDQLLENNQPQV